MYQRSGTYCSTAPRLGRRSRTRFPGLQPGLIMFNRCTVVPIEVGLAQMSIYTASSTCDVVGALVEEPAAGGKEAGESVVAEGGRGVTDDGGKPVSLRLIVLSSLTRGNQIAWQSNRLARRSGCVKGQKPSVPNVWLRVSNVRQ
jgi:hypothetical protein